MTDEKPPFPGLTALPVTHLPMPEDGVLPDELFDLLDAEVQHKETEAKA